jgi:hypothetical protein
MKALTSVLANWLPDMDLNHDKQIQSLLCYRYTIGQAGAFDRLKSFSAQSSQQRRTGLLPVSNSLILNQRQAGSLSSN